MRWKWLLGALMVCFLLLPILFFNLGKLLDITQKPVKSDLIVCLGGGELSRVERSAVLYLDTYAKSDTLLLTGDDILAFLKARGYRDFRLTHLDKYHPSIKYLHRPELDTTGQEVKFIKSYMVERGFESALIVTDPPHALRIRMLTKLIDVEGDETLRFHIVGSGAAWWHKENYYEDAFGRGYALNELRKLITNAVAYGILDKIGLLDLYIALKKGNTLEPKE